MPKYKVTDPKFGKSYIVTANSADDAHQVVTNMVNNIGLAMPVEGQPPQNINTPTRRFGFTSADTINPIPAIAAMGDKMFGSIPIAGPYLQNWRDQTNAKVYGDTPQDARADMNKNVEANPIPAMVGEAMGNTLPYMTGAEVPLVRGVLGFEGPLLQRLGMAGASQFAINTGDNLAHGMDNGQAALKGATDAVAALPFAMFGKGTRIPENQQAAVNVLRSEGIPVTGGQMRGSKALMTMESQLGGAATQAFQEKQLSALTSAALKRAGISAKAATPDVLLAGEQRIGGNMDNLAGRTRVVVDTPLQNDLLKIGTDYQMSVGQPAPLIENFINRIGTLAQQNGGFLKGDNYKILVTDLREAASSTSSGEVAKALRKMRVALDDAVERSMGGQTRAAWQKLRTQYRNLATVQEAVGGAGQWAAKGYVTPPSLRQAVVGQTDKRQYAKGFGDLNKLSHAANAVMVTIPDSGTAGRASAVAAMSAIPVGGAALASGDIGKAAMIAGGLAAPAIAGRAMLAGPVRNMIGNGGSVIPGAVARGTIPSISSDILRIIGGGGQ